MLSKGHPNLVLQPERRLESNVEIAIEYYIRLLSIRKQAFDIAKGYLLQINGVEPTLSEIRGEAQKLVGNRGMTIASKGYKDRGKRNQFFDEETLVLAFVHSIVSGNDTTLLTYDGDFIDQFVKLQYVFDTHYRSYRLSEEFKIQPRNFQKEISNEPIFPSVFSDVEIYSMPMGMPQRLLEHLENWVNFDVQRFCKLPDGKIEVLQTVFQADTDMSRLLNVKGKTKGSNTDCLDGRNIHLSIQPRLAGRVADPCFPGCIAIVKDKYVANETGLEINWTVNDFDLVLTPSERTGNIFQLSRPDDKRQAKNLEFAHSIAAFKVSDDYQIYCEKNFASVEKSTLGQGLMLMPPWTRVIVDRSFRKSSLNGFREHCGQTKFYGMDSINNENVASGGILSLREYEAGTPKSRIFNYYLAILAHRKMSASRMADEYLSSNGVPISKHALNELLVERAGGNLREASLEFLHRQQDENVFDDEKLVALATLRAVFDGCETVIITKKRAVVDQFLALAQLLFVGYQGWALCHANKELTFEKCESSPDEQPDFGSHVGVVFDLPFEQVGNALPASPVNIQVSCWLIDETRGTLVYCFPSVAKLPRPMHGFLEWRGGNATALPNFPGKSMFMTRHDGFFRCAFVDDEELNVDLTPNSGLSQSISISKFDAFCSCQIGVGAETPWLRKAKAEVVNRNNRKRRKRRGK